MNWWDGKALDQNTHRRINVQHYPGTRQLCCDCDEPTGRCTEDEMYVGDHGPLCEVCYEKSTIVECVGPDAQKRGE